MSVIHRDVLANQTETLDQMTEFVGNRRELLAGATVAALGLGAVAANAQGATYTPHASWRSLERRLVRRLTNGITLDDVRKSLQLGFEGYLEYQLNPEAIDDSVVATKVAATWPTLTMTPRQLYSTTDDMVPKQLTEATIYRSTFSKRQLYERMVEFWSDHFNIHLYKDDCFYLKTYDDRLVIRRFALKTFRELLNASARSSAMLVYLDNASSRVGDPNQNYARELMELHTIGVDGGYTQRDVEEVARCFTGWTYIGNKELPTAGQFFFDVDAHDDGAKVVLGHRIPAGGGYNDGLRVLGILGNLPQTHQFIGRKLCRWLLRYDPPQSLVNEVAATFASTNGNIKAMIRTIMTRANLTAAPAKLKRPNHLIMSLLRSLNATVTTFDSLRWSTYDIMGMGPFEWAPPNGYPDSNNFWSGLMLPRWNCGFDLCRGYLDGVTVDIPAFLGTATTPAQILAKINEKLFAGEINPAENAALFKFLTTGELNDGRILDSIGLAACMPSYQHF